MLLFFMEALAKTVPSKGWYVGLHGNECCSSLSDSFGRLSSGCLNLGFLSGLGPQEQSGSHKWSHK
jgi:hypothetical protein